jgi:hypothetical protein
MVATFECREDKEKIYLKMQTNTVLRVRKFQQAHAPLITELRCEILRIFLECGVSLFH